MRIAWKELENPVICPEHLWEGSITYVYGSAIKIGGKYRLYYQSFVQGIGYFVNLAESEDGVNWEKPLIKKLKASIPRSYPTVEIDSKVEDFYRKTGSLECMSNVVSTCHSPTVIYRPDDEYPYKLFGYTSEGYCVSLSKDGINFMEYEGNPVIPLKRYPNRKTKKVWFSDVAPVFYDTKKGIYRAMVKTYKIDKEGRTRRCVGMSTSRDFINWTRPHTLWVPDESFDRIAQEKGFSWADFYRLCVFNYEDYYLGLLHLFLIEEEIPRGTHLGYIEVYLARSKNCIDWDLVSDRPLIERKGWHKGNIQTVSFPIVEEGKIMIYFSGGGQKHGQWEISGLDPSHKTCIGLGFLEI